MYLKNVNYISNKYILWTDTQQKHFSGCTWLVLITTCLIQGELFFFSLYFPINNNLPLMILSWEFGSGTRDLPMDFMRIRI